MQAKYPVTTSLKNAKCTLYNYTSEYCKGIITSMYYFGDKRKLEFNEDESSRIKSFFDVMAQSMSDKCSVMLRDLLCRYYFPPCDTSLEQPQARRICRSSCEYLVKDVCKQEIILIRTAAKTNPLILNDLQKVNCTLWVPSNGGDAPECYQWPDLPGTHL